MPISEIIAWDRDFEVSICEMCLDLPHGASGQINVYEGDRTFLWTADAKGKVQCGYILLKPVQESELIFLD
jgi:hypothetical protein